MLLIHGTLSGIAMCAEGGLDIDELPPVELRIRFNGFVRLVNYVGYELRLLLGNIPAKLC